VQPPDTVLLDLNDSPEAILARMKSKWRYNIRLAERSGVVVRRGSGADVGAFYDLYRTTAARDKIALHRQGYYENLLALPGTFPGAPDVGLYLAEHDGDTLAAIVTIFTATEGTYLYGASSNEKRNLMPAYLLQWQAIQDARAQGCLRYDLYGIPPTADPHHPMHGLYLFKTGFGGIPAHRVGSLDLPLSPLYGPYRAAEAARTFWHKRVVKLLR
jgi:lipid II:glycine glycyltransferase (peptidoglycan interpeptide bridge formation enzyme)